MFTVKNKKSLILFTSLILALILVTGCNKAKKEDFIAVVNGEGIEVEDFEIEYNIHRKAYEMQLGKEAMSDIGPNGLSIEDNLKHDLVDKLVIEKLIAQKSKEKDLKVSNEEVQEQIDMFIDSVGGKETFDDNIKKSGVTEQYLRDNIRKELLFYKYKEDFVETSDVTEEKAEEYFEENKNLLTVVKAKHILLNTEEDAKKIKERLDNGENFEELAMEKSLDSASGSIGGDLGYFAQGEMLPEFNDAVFSMEEGEISEPVKSNVGYHIIFLEDKKDTFEDLKDEILYLLREQEFRNHLIELKEASEIKVNDEKLEEVKADTDETDEVEEKEEIKEEKK